MIVSPGNVFDALDDVIVKRWFEFIKDPMLRRAFFLRHKLRIDSSGVIVTSTSMGLDWANAFGMIEGKCSPILRVMSSLTIRPT
jgi:hypothetical protein